MKTSITRATITSSIITMNKGSSSRKGKVERKKCKQGVKGNKEASREFVLARARSLLLQRRCARNGLRKVPRRA